VTEVGDQAGTPAEAPITPRKGNPEAFALRGQPARAVRFKRGAVIAAAALGSVSLVATAWFALLPSALYRADRQDEQPVAAKAPADALAKLPGSYDAAPRLGPPLPGDLGRPILEHQRAMAVAPTEADGMSAERAAAAERERQAAELRTARESGLLIQTTDGAAPAAGGDTSQVVPAAASDGVARLAIDPDRDPNGQQRKADFVTTVKAGDDINTHPLVAAASTDMLSAGSVIAASLITGLRSDLPGLVIAQVTERVFDSATGTTLLIPQGARLIGSYDSVVAFGQQRALVVWQRIVMPDGSSVRLENETAADPSGYAGLADKVDFHTWSLLKGAAISTLLGVGTDLSFSGESDLVQAIRESTQQNASRAGDQLTSRNLSVQPTITIRPGAAVRLIVHRDLILAPWHG